MDPSATCDVCGQAVPSDEMVEAEVSVSQLMCPISMTFHRSCHERASSMWQPDDSCSFDPDFPEMQAWAANVEGRGVPRFG